MDVAATDVFQRVEYARDKWIMGKVPLALLLCLVGLVFVIYLYPEPSGYGLLIGFIALVLVTAGIVIGAMLLEQAYEGRSLLIRILAGIAAFPFLVVFDWGPFYPRGAPVPPDAFGWMLIMAGVGWTAYALFRHVKPGRPMLTLTPAGLTYYGTIVTDLFIPWQEIESVGELEDMPAFGFGARYADTTAIVVSQAFYESRILAKRRYRAGRRGTWDATFRPKGSAMQMSLHYLYLDVAPKDIREPVTARWKAFHATPAVAPNDAAGRGPPLVYGRWSFDRSLWQAMTVALPLLGIVIVLAMSMGVF